MFQYIVEYRLENSMFRVTGLILTEDYDIAEGRIVDKYWDFEKFRLVSLKPVDIFETSIIKTNIN